ncbi:hypothetical protein ACFQ7M_31840 [Streptomyces massasporeus]
MIIRPRRGTTGSASRATPRAEPYRAVPDEQAAAERTVGGPVRLVGVRGHEAGVPVMVDVPGGREQA